MPYSSWKSDHSLRSFPSFEKGEQCIRIFISKGLPVFGKVQENGIHSVKSASWLSRNREVHMPAAFLPPGQILKGLR